MPGDRWVVGVGLDNPVRDVCLSELTFLERIFRELERRVPPPIEHSVNGKLALRYKEQSPHQAILLKFARQISGLHAIDVLLLNGFVQEQGVIQRTLDEVAEDILFLAAGVITENWSDLHKQFCSYFWEEEFEHPDAMKSRQKRGTVARNKIRAFNNRAFQISDPSTADRAGESIHKAYSGYVHAAAGHIMDMCGGEPLRFYLSGMRGTYRQREHAADAVTYFYRGLMSAGFAARAFGNEALALATHRRVRDFENAHGEHVLPDWARAKGSQ